jgi:hypothetical protein
MTRKHSQFVSTIHPARHLHVSCLAAPNRGLKGPDDLNTRTIVKICILFATILGSASLIAVFPRASAQMIVPADRTLHAPDRFDFNGQWNCGEGASTAHLKVDNGNSSTESAPLRLPGAWTKVRETQGGFNGNYFVGYDRDKSQFLMIDANDPASIAYFTEGWNGQMLLLTSTNDEGQLAPPHRIQYDINDASRFTVTWEYLEGASWKAEPGVTCIKVDRGLSIIPPMK